MIEYFELGQHLDLSGCNNLHPLTALLLKSCEKHSYITVRDLRFAEHDNNRSEYLIIDAADGTVASGNQAHIRRKERLAIEINTSLKLPVLVHALRKDFPVLSHQHAGKPNSPRTLCLYEASWSAVERNWTPERFLDRIFWWLRESAEQRLHREDQPLEQLFYMSPYQLILPANHLYYHNAADHKLSLQRVGNDYPITLRAIPESESTGIKPVRLLTIAVSPVEASSVATYPDNLGKLQEQLNTWGSELFQQLIDTVFEAIPDSGILPSSGNEEGLLILLWVPRLRDGTTERVDVMGYVVQSSLLELACALDILAPKNEQGIRHRVRLLGGAISTKWQKIPLLPVEVRSSMNASQARDLSAIESDVACFNGVLAGVGALGGTLADIWIRSGWGKWTFIDPDQLLPHNLSRHIGFDAFVGQPKVQVVQHLAANIYPHEPIPIAINKSILEEDDDITKALEEAHLVVDVSTTLEVPRTLALRNDIPRIVSLFLTPSGRASVMLIEDADRKQRIDALEGQYYRAILGSEWGKIHLQHNYGDRWVGGGCRDISVRMSNECIHLHAGILSRQLRSTILKECARLCIWESDETSGSVDSYEVKLYPVISIEIDGWVVKYDLGLVQKLKDTRFNALPNETGGAIIGITDFKNRTIVLVDVFPEPVDSQASPSFFVRGEAGQQEALERTQKMTAHVVDYVGEWHSHPQGYSARTSSEDDKLINRLHQKMNVDGLPAVMVIVAENDINIVVK
ncbi:ThiF family adenylyltransferase [Pectobacterium brasiliense]|uniref:ThiF family adenylyltransferase n=1 Tax=Pectobacterium brasiliense TaxID=180957 RepID=UPI0032EB7BE5